MVGRPRLVKAGDPQAAGQHLSGSVQALDRGLNLLAIIAEADGLPLTSIAQRAGIAPSTAHRILTTLKANGFVLDDTHGNYLIGVQAFRVGSAFLRNRKLAEVGRELAVPAARLGHQEPALLQVQLEDLLGRRQVGGGEVGEEGDPPVPVQVQDRGLEQAPDLLADGVIDPAKVVRSALQNAASVAGLLLTTEALVAEKPKEKEAAGGGGHGHQEF